MRRTAGHRPVPPGRLLLATLALLVLSGCRVDVAVEVEAAARGGGRVRAVVTLDEEAAGQVPDLAGQLRVDDLEAAGWAVEGPTVATGGGAVVEASKPFGSPEGAAVALEELGGASGPFDSLRLSVDRGFWKTTTTVEGTVDLSAGLGVFGDETLEQRLGGPNLGIDTAAVERELGRPLSEVFTFEVVADLPGRIQATTGERRGGDAVWPAALGTAVPVRATSEAWNVPTVLAVGVAAVSGLSLVAVLVRRSRRISWG